MKPRKKITFNTFRKQPHFKKDFLGDNPPNTTNFNRLVNVLKLKHDINNIDRLTVFIDDNKEDTIFSIVNQLDKDVPTVKAELLKAIGELEVEFKNQLEIINKKKESYKYLKKTSETDQKYFDLSFKDSTTIEANKKGNKRGRPTGKYYNNTSYVQGRILKTSKAGINIDAMFIQKCTNNNLSTALVRHTLEKLFIDNNDIFNLVKEQYIKEHLL